MECFACGQNANQRCSRCGNPYCGQHGADLCAACLDPLNAAPSHTAFRVTLFGLLAVCVLALWLLIRPPSLPGEPSTASQPTSTPAASPTGQPGGSPSPGPSGSPAATAAPTLGPTPAPTAAPGPLHYTVQDGDTWIAIAEAFGVDAENLAATNGLTLDDVLHPGDVLVIPQ